MEARGKLSRIFGSALQYIRDYTDKGKEVSRGGYKTVPGKSASRNGTPNRMTRVTDDLGNEYYCPTGVLKDANFVKEEEKNNCFDYKILSADRLG